MKLLLFHNYYQESGGESLVFEQEQDLLRQFGHELTQYTRDNREILQYDLWQKIAFFANAIYSRGTYRDVKQLVVQAQPDVALVQNVFPLMSPSIYQALAALNIPIIQLVFNYRLICPNAHLYTQGAICERCVQSRNYWYAARYRCFRGSHILSALYASILSVHRTFGTFDKIDAFVVPDETLKTKLSEGGYEASKIHVNSYPFDISLIKPTYLFDDYIVFVGRFIPQKGVRTLLRAMALVKSQVRLILVGSGPQEGELLELIEQLDLSNVEVIGQCWGDALGQLISRSLAVVVPSEWYDNSPRIVYEAFAWGKPVIGSRIPGVTDAVADTTNGLLFQVGDSAELAATIDLLAKLKSNRKR